MLVGRLDPAGGLGREAGGAALRLELGDAEVGELDDVLGGAVRPVGGDRVAHALDPRARPAGAGRRPAGRRSASRRARRRRAPAGRRGRRRPPARSPPARRRSRSRAGRPAADGAGRRRRKAGRSASSWTVCIGTRIRPKRASPRSNAWASARTVRIAQPLGAGARGQLGEQRAVEVERGHRVAGARQRQRHPAGAGADVEHRAGLRGGQLAPQRQVGRVGAALDVVPDHDLGDRERAHRQYSRACPRSASSWRSSSSAV